MKKLMHLHTLLSDSHQYKLDYGLGREMFYDMIDEHSIW